MEKAWLAEHEHIQDNVSKKRLIKKKHHFEETSEEEEEPKEKKVGTVWLQYLWLKTLRFSHCISLIVSLCRNVPKRAMTRTMTF